MAQPSDRSVRRLVVGCVVLGIVARLVPHPWNVSPVTAIALFAGAHLPRRWALGLVWLLLACTDLILGWHTTLPFTWAAFSLTVLFGRWARQQLTTGRLIIASVASSLLFFIITNFGVWLVGELYPRTLEGLSTCYVAAIPFFRNTLLGDLVYTGVFFGSFSLLTGSLRPSRAHHTAAVH